MPVRKIYRLDDSNNPHSYRTAVLDSARSNTSKQAHRIVQKIQTETLNKTTNLDKENQNAYDKDQLSVEVQSETALSSRPKGLKPKLETSNRL